MSAVADGVTTAAFGDTGKTPDGNCKKIVISTQMFSIQSIFGLKKERKKKYVDHDFRCGTAAAVARSSISAIYQFQQDLYLSAERIEPKIIIQSG